VIVHCHYQPKNSFDLTKPFFSVYPNPSFGQIAIKISSLKTANIAVVDMLGKTLFTDTESSLDLSFQSEGVYFLKLNVGENLIATQKILLQ
jgi:hypothetical protein